MIKWDLLTKGDVVLYSDLTGDATVRCLGGYTNETISYSYYRSFEDGTIYEFMVTSDDLASERMFTSRYVMEDLP